MVFRWVWHHKNLLLAILFWGAGMWMIGLISFPNHYTFRTAALDMGYVLLMIENIIRGRFFDLIYGWDIPHFTHLMYILAIPFYLAAKDWGVLIFQWLFMGVAPWGLYALARRHIPEVAPWTMLHYFGMWGVHGAMGYDVHPELLGLCMVPWIFYAVDARKPALFFLSWILLVFSKEQHAILSLFILVSLWYLYRKTSFPRKYYYIALAISIFEIAFAMMMIRYLESKYNIPSIPNFLFQHLWSDNPFNPTSYPPSFLGKVKQLLKNLPYLWAMLWEPHIPDLTLRGIKSELHLSVLLTGGWTFFAYPVFLIALLPTYLYKTYAHSQNIWSILAHYNMEFAVIIPISVIWFFSHKGRKYSIWAVPLMAIWVNVYNYFLFRNTFAYFRSEERQYWYDCRHYYSPNYAWNYKAIRKALDKIPDTARVSAITRLHPHLRRDPKKLYLFPNLYGRDGVPAEYIALLHKDDWPSPLTPQENERYIDSLSHSPQWEVLHDEDNIAIFKARHSQSSSP